MMELLESTCKDKKVLKTYLSPIQSNLGEQETLFRCLLLCEAVQTKIVEILLDNAQSLAIELPSEEDSQLAAACIFQIRYLEQIFDSKAFLAPIFDKEIDKWAPNPRDTLIECLPEVLVDPLTHGDVALQLLDIMLGDIEKEPASLQSALLNTLCLLRIPENIAQQVRVSLCRHIMKLEATNLPDIISFSIQTLSTDTNCSFSQLLRDVDTYLKTEDLRINRNAKSRISMDEVMINTFEVICRYVQLEGSKGWREVSSFLRTKESTLEDENGQSMNEKSPSESTFSVFNCMLVLALRSMEGCPSSILNYLTNQITANDMCHVEDSCKFAMQFKKFSYRYSSSWMILAKHCIWSPLKEVRFFGGFIYQHLFVTVEKTRNNVISTMIGHLSVSDGEAEIILSTFGEILEKNIGELIPFVTELHKSLELIDTMGYDNIKKLFKILITIYTKESSQKKLKEDVEESISKMLLSVNEREQVLGILGMLVQLEYCLVENEPKREEILKDRVGKLKDATKKSNVLRSLFYKQLGAILKCNLKCSKSETIINLTDELFAMFKNDFFTIKSLDYLGHSSLEDDAFINKKSEMWLNCPNEKLIELVPLFELLKDCAAIKKAWNGEENIMEDDLTPFFFAFESNIVFSDIPDPKEIACSIEDSHKGANKLFHIMQWIRTLMNTFSQYKKTGEGDAELIESVWIKKFTLMLACEKGLKSFVKGVRKWNIPKFVEESETYLVSDMKSSRKRGAKRKEPAKKAKSNNENDNVCDVSKYDASMLDDLENEAERLSSEQISSNCVSIDLLHKYLIRLKLSTVIRLLTYVPQQRKSTTFILSELLDIFSRILPKKDVKSAPWIPKVSQDNSLIYLHGDAGQIWLHVLEAVPTIWKILDSTSQFFRSDLNTSSVYDQDTEISSEMIQLLKVTLNVLYSIFSWKEISVKKIDSDRIMRKRAKKRQSVMEKIEHTILNLHNSQQESEEIAEKSVLSYIILISDSSPSIEVAVCILDILASFDTWTPELRKKVASFALGCLKREWSDHEGKALKSALLCNPVKVILSHYISFRPEDQRLRCIQWLLANKVAALLPDGERRKSKMSSYEDSGDPELSNIDKNKHFYCFTDQTIYSIYKVLFTSLNNTVCCRLMAGRSDELKAGICRTTDVVADWQIAANSFCLLGLMLRVKTVRNATVLATAVKEGRLFLNNLFHKNSSFVYIAEDRSRARSVVSDLSTVLKSVQLGNRTLQNIGVYAKTVKSAALLKGLPDLRAANEFFMRTVQKLFVGMECHQAFEIGLLRSRNIDGDEIVADDGEDNETNSGNTNEPDDNDNTNAGTEDEREMSPVY